MLPKTLPYGQYYKAFYALYNALARTLKIRIGLKNEKDHIINKMIKQIIVILKFWVFIPVLWKWILKLSNFSIHSIQANSFRREMCAFLEKVTKLTLFIVHININIQVIIINRDSKFRIYFILLSYRIFCIPIHLKIKNFIAEILLHRFWW